MVTAAEQELQAAGVTDKPELVVADAGYCHQTQMENVINKSIQVLIPPDAGKRKDTRPRWQGGQYTWMRYLPATERGHALDPKHQVIALAGA